MLLKRFHGARHLGLCSKVTGERIWLTNVTKYSASKVGNIKSSGVPTMHMRRRVHFALYLCPVTLSWFSLCLGIGDHVYDKGEVTSQWRVGRGQAAKEASAEENIWARASATRKRGAAEEDAGDDDDNDDGDEEEEAEEDEDEKDEEDEEADSEVQEVKPPKHKEKEKVSSPPAVLAKRRFMPAVFVKEESSPHQSSKKTGSPRKKAPRRGDPSTVEINRMDSFLARYGVTTKSLAGHVQSC